MIIEGILDQKKFLEALADKIVSGLNAGGVLDIERRSGNPGCVSTIVPVLKAWRRLVGRTFVEKIPGFK